MMDLEADVWEELIGNDEIFNVDSSIVLSRMVDICEKKKLNYVTFGDLCTRPYGGYEMYYERESVLLAKRIYEYLESKNLERPSLPTNNDQWMELIYDREIRDEKKAWHVKPVLMQIFTRNREKYDPEVIKRKDAKTFEYIQEAIDFLMSEDATGNSRANATIGELFGNGESENKRENAKKGNAISFCCATKPIQPGYAIHPNYFYLIPNSEPQRFGLTGYLDYEETEHDKRCPEKDWGRQVKNTSIEKHKKELVKKIKKDVGWENIYFLIRNSKTKSPTYVQYMPKIHDDGFGQSKLHYEVLYKEDANHSDGNLYVELHCECELNRNQRNRLKLYLEKRHSDATFFVWYESGFGVRLKSGTVPLQSENRHVKDDAKILDEIKNAFVELYKTLNDDIVKCLNFRTESAVKNLLLANQQIILNGPPGTGKTFIAYEVAKMIVLEREEGVNNLSEDVKKRICQVQFHPGYDYSDFIIGLKPKLIKDSSCGETAGKKVLSYEWKDGVFKEFADSANECYIQWKKAHKESSQKEEPKLNDFVLIIDEINRADLSNVFGEAFSRLEKDYRGKPVKLPNGVNFILPPNLYIIGTMNDIDRSVESMDFALRRRFSWYEVSADDSKRIIREKVKDENLRKRLLRAMEAVNNLIIDPEMGLGREYQLGGAYFAGLGEKWEGNSEEYLRRLWKYHIQVILNDYLRGKKNRKKLLDKFENKFFEQK